MNLYHFTCEHGRDGIGDVGELVPPQELELKLDVVAEMADYERELLSLVWVTDLEWPFRLALGLTSNDLYCDRTQFRYRVTDTSMVKRWMDVRRAFPRKLRGELERVVGVHPQHWFISTFHVPVVFDPVRSVDTRERSV